jgi:excisionase family DNA binding protein
MAANLTTARSVAQALGVSIDLVYDLAARGEIPCVRLGRLVRFDLEAVRKAVVERRSDPEPQPAA